MLLSAYVVAGVTVGVAAWIVCGRVGGADPNAGLNYNLQSITAVVIGGTSLFGGRGLVVGSLIGALIVQVFNSGLALAGVDPNYQVLATGILVILAVSVDQWIRRVQGMTETQPQRGRPTGQPILEAEGMVKLFGRVVGLRGVDLGLYPRRGAGRHRRQRRRQVDADQVPVRRDDPRPRQHEGRRPAGQLQVDPGARVAGIETVYQTLAVAPALDIASNLYLAREIRRPGFAGSVLRMLDTKAMRDHASEHIKSLGISTLQNINQAVETLSGGQRQIVAVARTGAFGSKVAILDEPTAALGVRETAQVLRLVRDLRDQGLGGHPDQPQHAERLRDRRPDPHPAARRPCRA